MFETLKNQIKSTTKERNFKWEKIKKDPFMTI